MKVTATYHASSHLDLAIRTRLQMELEITQYLPSGAITAYAPGRLLSRLQTHRSLPRKPFALWYGPIREGKHFSCGPVAAGNCSGHIFRALLLHQRALSPLLPLRHGGIEWQAGAPPVHIDPWVRPGDHRSVSFYLRRVLQDHRRLVHWLL